MAHRLFTTLSAFVGLGLIFGGLISGVSQKAVAGDETYNVTITNMMTDELLAPVLIAPSTADRDIFDGNYVTPEAEEQILSGDPAMLKARIGKKAMVGHGTDGPPGVLLAPGKSITIEVKARHKGALRVIAMVAPTKFPDNFVTVLVNPKSMLESYADRYDIGYDEGDKMTSFVSSAAAKITVEGDMMMDDNN